MAVNMADEYCNYDPTLLKIAICVFSGSEIVILLSKFGKGGIWKFKTVEPIYRTSFVIIYRFYSKFVSGRFRDQKI